MNRVFITGMGRSGTTLVDKLLTGHQNIEVLSQPFPLLFIEVKKLFLKTLNISKYYVLNDNVYNEDYHLEDFNVFLESHKFKYADIVDIFYKMENYSGQTTKINLNIPKRSYTFIELYDKLIETSIYKTDLKYYGSKEIMCEEFIPFFIKNDTKVIIVVRDPRDVVASINYPKKDKYLGEKKPILFILRSWRRSIEYLHNNSDSTMVVKYEDLVIKPYVVLNEVTKFLNIKSFESNHFSKGIIDRNGELWKANSSFNTQTSFISSESVNGYKKVLENDEINYIETICYKEMMQMNYELTTKLNKTIISKFKDSNIAKSDHIEQDYSSSIENILKEIEIYEKNTKVDG